MAQQSCSPTFGLVAGLGVGAGVFYYRSLVSAHLARGLSPSLLMVHADVRRVMALAGAREALELAEYLTGLLQRLANGGAKMATIPAFSPQVCAKELAASSPLPLLNILDVIVDEVVRRRLQRIAIFGARVTMETKLFGRLENRVDVVSPRAQEIGRLNEIYVRIVETEQASHEDHETLRDLAHRLVERERLDAILLAGTDLSFVFDPGNTDFPHLDGARAHIDAIMKQIAPP
jgi:aspartate racemase